MLSVIRKPAHQRKKYKLIDTQTDLYGDFSCDFPTCRPVFLPAPEVHNKWPPHEEAPPLEIRRAGKGDRCGDS